MGKSDHLVFIIGTKKKKSHWTQTKKFIIKKSVHKIEHRRTLGSYTATKNDNVRIYIYQCKEIYKIWL